MGSIALDLRRCPAFESYLLSHNIMIHMSYVNIYIISILILSIYKILCILVMLPHYLDPHYWVLSHPCIFPES